MVAVSFTEHIPQIPAAVRDLPRWFKLDEILEILPEIQRWVAANRNDRNLGEIAEDLEEQLAWLFRKDFAWRAGFGNLREYPRRLRAIRSRLGRLSSLPIVKDLVVELAFADSAGKLQYPVGQRPSTPARAGVRVSASPGRECVATADVEPGTLAARSWSPSAA